jgi:hypothetical protein
MATVKVWNDHDREHVEKFKNQEIRIPAGGCIEMDYIDAIDFKGQYFGMKMLGPNNPDPRYFKKIRVEEPATPVVKEDPNMFHATGKAASSPQEIIAMAKALQMLNPELAVKDQDLDADLAKKSKSAELEAENARLRAQLAAIQGKKKPGPKPKEKVA